MWASSDVVFELDAAATEDPVVTMEITTPDGTLVVMGEPYEDGRRLIARAVHVHGIGLAVNGLGVAKLRVIVQAVLWGLDYDELVVEGAVRTTGAQQGRRPKPIRFVRRSGASRRFET